MIYIYNEDTMICIYYEVTLIFMLVKQDIIANTYLIEAWRV